MNANDQFTNAQGGFVQNGAPVQSPVQPPVQTQVEGLPFVPTRREEGSIKQSQGKLIIILLAVILAVNVVTLGFQIFQSARVPANRGTFVNGGGPSFSQNGQENPGQSLPGQGTAEDSRG